MFNVRHVLGRLRHAVGNIMWLKPLRLRLGYALIMPWEWPTNYGVEAAIHFPRFQRGHENEEAAAEDLRRIAGYTMTKYDRSIVLSNLVKHMEDRSIPGALVECGVWRGGSSGIMALSNLRWGRVRRPLVLFDTWGDWPNPTEDDTRQWAELVEGRLVKADNTGAYEACRHLLEEVVGYPAEAIVYHRGLFEMTLPMAGRMGSIAVLRLDCDWYDSVRLCLEHLAPLVSPGGVVLIDDYGYCEGARKAVDEYIAAHTPTVFLHYVDYTCRYFMMPG